MVFPLSKVSLTVLPWCASRWTSEVAHYLLRRVSGPDLVKAERPCVGGLSSEHKWWLPGALHLNSAFLFFRPSISHALRSCLTFHHYRLDCTVNLPLPGTRLSTTTALLQGHLHCFGTIDSICDKSRCILTACLLSPTSQARACSRYHVIFRRRYSPRERGRPR